MSNCSINKILKGLNLDLLFKYVLLLLQKIIQKIVGRILWMAEKLYQLLRESDGNPLNLSLILNIKEKGCTRISAAFFKLIYLLVPKVGVEPTCPEGARF